MLFSKRGWMFFIYLLADYILNLDDLHTNSNYVAYINNLYFAFLEGSRTT